MNSSKDFAVDQRSTQCIVNEVTAIESETEGVQYSLRTKINQV
jgi:hypothetical protein